MQNILLNILILKIMNGNQNILMHCYYLKKKKTGSCHWLVMSKMRHSAISHPFVYGPLGHRPSFRFGKVGAWRGWWMGHGSQHKSRLAAVTFAPELHCLNRAGARLNFTSRWQGHLILILFVCCKIALQKIGHMLKLRVSKFHDDLSVVLFKRHFPLAFTVYMIQSRYMVG